MGEGPFSPLPGWASALCPDSGTKGASPRPRVPQAAPSRPLGPWSTCDAFLLLQRQRQACPRGHSWSLTTRDLPGVPAAQVRPSRCLGSCAISCLGQGQGPLCAPAGMRAPKRRGRVLAGEAGTLSGGMTPPSSGARVGVGSLGTFRFH